MDTITEEDLLYPVGLKNTPHAPKKLYIKGNKKLLTTKIISIVGSRECSKEGVRLAEFFSKGLVEQGITIASGMAIGIDTAAHKYALDAKGGTIAVLPSGLNKVYPEENEWLYKRILENNGLIITEYKANVDASKQNFLDRNRIVSGIALGVLIIESKYRSGTSVTSEHAIKQGKKVFALPHEVYNKNGVGNNELIKKGKAQLVLGIKDILTELGIEFTKDKENIPEESIKEEKTERVEKIINCANKTYKKVYELLQKNQFSIDELYSKLDMSTKKINNLLLMMEIEGYVAKTASGYKFK